ncbi:MAG: gliding motility-associated C-terminal domain-containing protein [Taibaiella sp.]|nr:gliding motility-associated C-terminal domain-containing protein [Taibaiella sp.]
MKIRSLLSLLALVCGLAPSISTAQIVGTDCFLQGHWVEVGINQMGGFGTCTSPTTYHTHNCCWPTVTSFTPGAAMDMSYDPYHDGWGTGAPPLMGAYSQPGYPQEGWSIEIAGTEYRNGAWGGLCSGEYDVTGSITGYSNIGGTLLSTWSGGVAGINIRQVTRIDTEASWIVMTAYLYNTTAAPISGVYFQRTLDPDNVSYWGGGATTRNIIVHQNEDESHRVMVSANGETAGSATTPAYDSVNSYLALAARDCRARCVVISGLTPTTVPSTLWSYGSGVVLSALGSRNLADQGISIVFNVGIIGAGDSAAVSYAYIFDRRESIDSAFPNPQLVVNGTAYPSIYPPAPENDTFNVCSAPGAVTIPANIRYGDEKHWTWGKWTWAPSTGLASTTGVTNTINVGALSGPTTYTITGTDSATGMYSCNQKTFYLTVLPCHSATSNSPGPDVANMICEGDTLKLIDKGDSTGATYLWYGPGPTIAGAPIFAVQNPVKYPTTMADTGWYHVIKTVGGASDTVDTHVMLRKRPNVTATYNPPVCETNTLNLLSNPDYPSETWTWTGPGGYTSTLSDPSRTPANVAMSGDYKVVTELFGCFDSSSISVVVNPMPVAPAMSYNTVLCEDSTLYLSSSSSPGATYTWSGPTSFSSTLQNPTISGVKPTLHNGTYTVTAALGVCTISSTITLSVTPTHEPILGSNSPVCSGNSLNFTASPPVPGCTFAWTGPLGFTSTLQYPSINPAFTPNSGIYYVIATLDSCPSLLTPISVVVDSTPEVPVLSTNSPGPPGNTICQEDTLTFTAFSPTGAGVTYHWYGPSSFSSTQQNPVILPATPVNSGVYTVIATLGACTSTATIAATVTPTPPISVSSNSAICAGDKDTVKLFATGNPGSTFTWIGPYTFFSAAANPVRTPAMVEYSGPYTATVLLDGCTNTAIVDYKVKPVPAPPMTKWLTFCQYYDAPYLQAFGTNVLWYPSSDPTAAGTSVAPKPPTDAVGVQFYYVTQTLNGCTSAIDSFRVRIDPTPTVTVSEGADVCPRDSVKLVATNPDAIAYYHWSPPLYLSDTASAVVTAYPETDVEYMVISSNVYGCSDTGKVSIRVKDNAVLHIPDSVLIFPGESYHIQPMTNCSRFTWTPSGGLTGKYISNPVATPEISTKYVVTGVTEDGCIVKDSILIRVNDESAITVPNAFAPGRGNNDLFKVIRRGDATLRHFRVYNRWGTVVFQTTNIDEGWDGTYKGTPQPVGVYVYEVSAVSSNGKEILKSGNVTLLR